VSKLTLEVRDHPYRSASIALILALALAAAVLTAQRSNASARAADRTAPSTKAAAPQSAVGVQVGGRLSRFNAINLTDTPCTTSTTFVAMPGTVVGFNNHLTTNARSVVLFQGEWFNNDRALLRLVIDGAVQSGPGDGNSPFAADSGNDAGSVIDETNGFDFISDPLAPGIHHAQIFWASVGGGQICVDERSLIVEHS
jgi:hypothetical protein